MKFSVAPPPSGEQEEEEQEEQEEEISTAQLLLTKADMGDLTAAVENQGDKKLRRDLASFVNSQSVDAGDNFLPFDQITYDWKASKWTTEEVADPSSLTSLTLNGTRDGRRVATVRGGTWTTYPSGMEKDIWFPGLGLQIPDPGHLAPPFDLRLVSPGFYH